MNTRPPVSEIVHIAVLLMGHEPAAYSTYAQALDEAISLYDTAETRINVYFDAHQQPQRSAAPNARKPS